MNANVYVGNIAKDTTDPRHCIESLNFNYVAVEKSASTRVSVRPLFCSGINKKDDLS